MSTSRWRWVESPTMGHHADSNLWRRMCAPAAATRVASQMAVNSANGENVCFHANIFCVAMPLVDTNGSAAILHWLHWRFKLATGVGEKWWAPIETMNTLWIQTGFPQSGMLQCSAEVQTDKNGFIFWFFVFRFLKLRLVADALGETHGWRDTETNDGCAIRAASVYWCMW